jgi:hypothetical protein
MKQSTDISKLLPVPKQTMKQNTYNKDNNSDICKTEPEWHHCSQIPDTTEFITQAPQLSQLNSRK